MRWWYARYESADGFPIVDRWEKPPADQHDKKLDEFDAAWSAREHGLKKVQYMFVVDDSRPPSEMVRREGIIEDSAWEIWRRGWDERNALLST